MRAPDFTGSPCQSQDPEVMFPEDERPLVPVPVLRSVPEQDDLFGRIGDALDSIDGRQAEDVRWVPNEAVEAAKAQCRGCDMREVCLAWALETGQDHGVWGGLTGRERRAMKRKHYRTAVQSETLAEVSA